MSCTLCGGKVVNGKCRECGLDNTKNDKKYRLNQHSSKDTVFVHDNCDDGVNKERGEKKIQPKKAASERTLNKPRTKSEARQVEATTKKVAAPKRRKSCLGRIVKWIIILVIAWNVLSVGLGVLVEEYGDTLDNFVEYVEQNVQMISGSDSGQFVPAVPAEVSQTAIDKNDNKPRVKIPRVTSK